ncbi:TonB-dependent Receptor Plug Domain [Microbulbifer donghaiensis]|uniref:TonB-dependent Receptor Plug Domain n=1 Tax=Microbulbifer donghaiensis TaxID=494016 RepID=A0A1M4ZGV1_9GAMM|nr:TonB-dependent receptor [Microbulbifer donghaiensis]SHF17205.1 TonB-dependent Receptor Plug Domain [Microbulbifer donghaiensis]
MIQSTFRKSLLAIAVGAALSAPVYAADDTRGHLRGALIADGANASGVTITITGQKQGISRTFVTTGDGEYRFPAIAAGVYDIVATKDGLVIAEQKGVEVGLGGKTTFNLVAAGAGTIEELEVVGKQMDVDTSSAVKDFVVNTSDLAAKIPLGRDLTSVALMAPSAVAADQSFAANNHDVATPAISGASAAENACFVNGLNITNFRNGLGCSQIPFDFIETVQVKNGGYNAEFGRSIGGVINTTTKRGGNEFESGVKVIWEPGSLQGSSPDTAGGASNKSDELDQVTYAMWASGAIIQDKLFYYALYAPQATDKFNGGDLDIAGRNYDSSWQNDFWGVKLDYIIADGHTLEYTGFDDTRVEEETNRANDPSSTSEPGTTEYFRGGENHSIKYTGVMNDWVTVSAQWGMNEYARSTTSSADAFPAIYDDRQGTLIPVGDWASFQTSMADDEREAFRLDVDMYLGDHSIRFGIDHEINTATDVTQYSGGAYYRYYEASASNGFVTAGLLEEGDEYVRKRVYQSGGEFETVASALYIQDEWQINDQLTLHAGIRNESFDNKNAEGDSFIKIDNQWAPRLGVSYDPTGDATSRIYANYGRYYLPIAANTNIRMAGAEYFTADWYKLDGINSDWTPIYNEANLLDSVVYGDGTVADTSEILDTNIEPMYQDEFILGYEWNVGDSWNFGVRGVYRDLKSTIEDVAIDAAVLNRGLCDPSFCGGFHWYVLTNPGFDMNVNLDVDGDGTLDGPFEFSAGELGYPKATRTYKALEFTFDREWDGNWMMGGSLVLSKSEGNHEGYVKSDNAQDDAGITTSFDQPGLTHGMDGYLPNDRRWVMKTWASYQFDNGLLLGGSFTAQDGRPINCIGVVPDSIDPFAGAYGAAGMYCGGELQPRGSHGRTNDIFNFDLTARYAIPVSGFTDSSEVVLQADIFNVFDSDTATEVDELGEDGGMNPNPFWKTPTRFQKPRTVRFTASYNF